MRKVHHDRYGVLNIKDTGHISLEHEHESRISNRQRNVRHFTTQHIDVR